MARACKYGKLKKKVGRRVCKLRPRRVTRRSSKAAQEAAMWRNYKPSSLGRRRSRRSRR